MVSKPAAVAGREDPLEASLAAALDNERIDEYGAVFTRRWVVELILDLVGFTPDRDLAAMHAIEPACGEGAFLGPMVERLVESCRRHGRPLGDAVAAIRACDLQPAHVEASRALVAGMLAEAGLDLRSAGRIAAGWIRHDDFLLSARREAVADFVVGNPPYIRLEEVAEERKAAYRAACPTMGGRADIFVGFYEVGLQALRPGGALGFICADRWMRNQYGARLRELVAGGFGVEATIEMHDVDAFAEEVSAYPSVTVIRRAPQGPAVVVNARRGFGAAAAARLLAWTAQDDASGGDEDFDVARLPAWFDGRTSWPAGSPERLALLAELERRLPLLEDPGTGTRVGIGIATGADKVFVTRDLDVAEPSQLVPLALPRDTMNGTLEWAGTHLVSPWAADGSGLVELDRFPRLAAYFERHAATLLSRHVAERRPQHWYRTIDRLDPALTARPKLLIPDIKAVVHPVLDEGTVYPHHNLYWVASSGWDLTVLGGLLLSRVAQLFVEAYAVRMRGGYLRFQAQYLRRIRVPQRSRVGAGAARELRRAFGERDVERATAVAMALYGIDELPR
jgi:adenine-specific DNA-methyltransferase